MSRSSGMSQVVGRSSHPIFQRFSPAKTEHDGRFLVDFLGVRARRAFHGNYRDENGAGYLRPDVQSATSEYFEWISLLCAVAAAPGEFAMLELGSGWGRWLLRGAMACRQLGKGFRLVGIEAEPEHYDWMKTAFRDNGIDPDEHLLLYAAVAGTAGEGWFLTGNPSVWYGQSLLKDSEAPSVPREPEVSLSRVRKVGLTELLQRFEKVHLVNMDVQGAESEIVEAAAEGLDRVVEMVHISTHSHEAEERLRACLTRMGWLGVFDFPCLETRSTPYGEIGFVDGIQVWVHPTACHLLAWLADGPILRQLINQTNIEKDGRAAALNQVAILQQQLLDEKALLDLRRDLDYLEELRDFSPAVVRFARVVKKAVRSIPLLGPLLRKLLSSPPS